MEQVCAHLHLKFPRICLIEHENFSRRHIINIRPIDLLWQYRLWLCSLRPCQPYQSCQLGHVNSIYCSTLTVNYFSENTIFFKLSVSYSDRKYNQELQQITMEIYNLTHQSRVGKVRQGRASNSMKLHATKFVFE